MIVIDASAMVELLMDTELGRRIDALVLDAAASHAPHLLDIEVMQVLRRFVLAGQVSAARAREALVDLANFPLERHAHGALIERVFELRANLTAYDATYLALAEALDSTLVTCDKALAKVAGARARVLVLT
jgi:predicted nucleic acid-binding protein